MVQAAAAAEVQTELASRVSNWRHKIQPLLDEQDARPAFDIHLYGDQVLDKLARLSCRDPDHAVELQTSMVCVLWPAAIVLLQAVIVQLQAVLLQLQDDTIAKCLGSVDQSDSNDGMLLTTLGLAPHTQAADCDQYGGCVQYCNIVHCLVSCQRSVVNRAS